VRGIEEIRDDRSHGARWLTRRAAEALLEIARERPEQIVQACRALAAAQPAMAPLVQLADRAMRAETAAEVAALCLRTLQDLERSGRTVIEHASGLIAHDCTVMTHSHSGTVEAVLIAAHERGTRFRVIATESQPLGEGADLARALRRAGIDVTLVADADVPAHVPASSLVMVGADAVTPAAVVNKAGTAAIAREARDHGVPFYVVCTSDKLAAAYEFDNSEHLYDLTPRDLITAVVTD
jgi:translation initiation factor 2B subunit (eIF-2B alpha/beta/delta family)